MYSYAMINIGRFNYVTAGITIHGPLDWKEGKCRGGF